MHRTSFWHLVDVLTQAGGGGYWNRRVVVYGRSPRPMYQQIAVAFDMFGGGRNGRKDSDCNEYWAWHCLGIYMANN